MPEDKLKGNLQRKAKNFKTSDGKLFFTSKESCLEVVGEDEYEKHKEIFETAHGFGHRGINKMWWALKKLYYGIPRRMVEDFVKNCEACSIHENFKTKDKVKNITANAIFERIQIDLIDVRQYEAENDGFNWLLHVIDVYSKFTFVFPMKTKTGKEVKKFFIEF